MEEPFVMLDLQDTALVLKSNPILEGRYPKSLTPREMDLLTTLFTTIDVKSGELATVRIRIRDLIKLFGLESSNSAHSDIVRVSENLLSRVIKVYNKEENTLTQHHFLARAKYFYNEGIAEFKFHDELKPYLVELSVYAKYVLGPFLALDSFYAKRIYELLIQYKNTARGDKKTWEREFTILDLRGYLGIEKAEYAKYSHFKARILETARRQINDRTDIHIEYNEVKMGRKVSSVQFLVTLMERPAEILHDPSLARLAGRIMSHGVAEEKARELVQKCDQELIAWALDELARRLKGKAEKPTNPAGWLVKAIEEDYRPQRSLFQVQEEEQRGEAARKQARIRELEETKQRVGKGYTAYVVGQIRAVIEGLERNERIDLEHNFTEALRNGGSFVASRFDGGQSWYAEPLVRPHAIRFLSERRAEFRPISEAEYAKGQGVEGYEDLVKEYQKLKEEL